MSNHKALPIANTIGSAGGEFYFAICQVCRQAIWLDRNKPISPDQTKNEGWKHDAHV
jgi:hypothetical protein